MLLPECEGSRHPHSVPLLAVLHQSVDVHRRANVRIYRATQQLKRVAIEWAKLEFPRRLVGGLVHTGVEHGVVEANLAGHATRHLTFALQQYGFNVVNVEPTLWVVAKERLDIESV